MGTEAGVGAGEKKTGAGQKRTGSATLYSTVYKRMFFMNYNHRWLRWFKKDNLITLDVYITL